MITMLNEYIQFRQNNHPVHVDVSDAEQAIDNDEFWVDIRMPNQSNLMLELPGMEGFFSDTFLVSFSRAM